jgi:uncharacterized membrane protein YbaN (DUF454 family)
MDKEQNKAPVEPVIKYVRSDEVIDLKIIEDQIMEDVDRSLEPLKSIAKETRIGVVVAIAATVFFGFQTWMGVVVAIAATIVFCLIALVILQMRPFNVGQQDTPSK